MQNENKWQVTILDAGTVTISKGNISIERFTFDCGGLPINYKLVTELVRAWVAERFAVEVDKFDFNVNCAAAPANAVGQNTQPVEGDAIAKCKRILNLVDEYFDKPSSGTRTTLRMALMDEFETLLAGRKATNQPECARPDLIEKLTYHAHERDDMSIDDLLEALSPARYQKVRQRSHRQLELQLLALMAGAPEPQDGLVSPLFAGPASQHVIAALVDVALRAFDLLDNAEESGPVGESVFTVHVDDVNALSDALDVLDALPDDQPGYVMGPAAKAQWALRHLLPSIAAQTRSASAEADAPLPTADVSVAEPASQQDAGNMPTEAQKEAMRDAISAALGEAMDCTRTWRAWGVGTMSEDDFQLVADNDERLDELVEAACSVLSAPVSPTPSTPSTTTGEPQ